MQNNIQSIGAIHDCTGCSMCMAVCPHSAIAVTLNQEGFYTPTVNEDECINCGVCKKVCYKFDAEINSNVENNVECLSAINRNETELEMASSGAVSIELMRQCLKLDFKVVGVAYNKASNMAFSEIVDTAEKLELFRGAKYFQSDTTKAFCEIANDKSEQKYAIFGTPCQIYAFSRLAEIRGKDRYLFIDIFCHGCPSIHLWKKYLEYSKTKFCVNDFDKISFRSKTHGWHEFCFTFTQSNTQFNSSKYSDPFYELFFDMNALNKACYDCIPRSSVNATDIRIGDFWGWQYDHNTDGVSAVVLCSEKGKALFRGVRDKFECKPHSFSEVIAAQSYGKIHSFNEAVRSETLALLSSKKELRNIIAACRKRNPIKVRVKRLLKIVLKHLPVKIYSSLRQQSHK